MKNAENKPHAHLRTYLHTMKVYNTRPDGLTIEVLLINILFFLTTEVFTCSKVINAFKRLNSWTAASFFAKHARLQSCSDSYTSFHGLC